MSVARGRFVTLEGIEGAGKTTQVRRIAAYLRQRGVESVTTREPGGTPLAESIRGIVLESRSEALPTTAELLLMFAARAVHLENLIEPCLMRGAWVICDRFTDATYAYQGFGRGIDLESIEALERMVVGARRPDLTVLFEMPVALGLARAAERNAGSQPDRFERERADFFERVRAGYLMRASAEPQRFAVIDATGAIDAVTAQICQELEARAWII